MFQYLKGNRGPFYPLYLVTVEDLDYGDKDKPFTAWVRQNRFMRKPYYSEYGRYNSAKEAWGDLGRYDCGYD